MQFRLDALLREPALQNAGVRGGDALALQALRPRIGCAIAHRNAQAALAEAQWHEFRHGLALFQQDVLPDDAEIGHAVGHILRDVVVTQ